MTDCCQKGTLQANECSSRLNHNMQLLNTDANTRRRQTGGLVNKITTDMQSYIEGNPKEGVTSTLRTASTYTTLEKGCAHCHSSTRHTIRNLQHFTQFINGPPIIELQWLKQPMGFIPRAVFVLFFAPLVIWPGINRTQSICT